MQDEAEELELELATSDSVTFGVLLLIVSVLWGVLIALLPASHRTPQTIVTFMIPLLVAWELGVITTHALLQYRSRVFGRLVDASTYLAAGVVLTVVDFTFVGLFFLLEDMLVDVVPGGVRTLFVVIILVGVAGYYLIYRSVRELLATTE